MCVRVLRINTPRRTDSHTASVRNKRFLRTRQSKLDKIVLLLVVTLSFGDHLMQTRKIHINHYFPGNSAGTRVFFKTRATWRVVPTVTHHQCWNRLENYRTRPNKRSSALSLLPRAHRNSEKHPSDCGQSAFRKVAKPLSYLLNYTQQYKEAHNQSEGKLLISEEAQNVQNCHQPAGQASKCKTEIRHQNTSFLSGNLSTMSEGNPATLSASCPHFLACKVHGHVAAQGHPPKLPVLEKKSATELIHSGLSGHLWTAIPPHVSQVRRKIPVRTKGIFLIYHVQTGQSTCF